MQAMASKTLTIASLFIITSLLPPLLQSQQPYEGLGISDCINQHNSASLLGYFCNGNSNSCQAFLTFHSQPPYLSVDAISNLLNSSASRLSALNSVSHNSTFPANTKVIVPVACSCAGGAYYQANSSYIVKDQDTEFIIANTTFQGLTSCQALRQQNNKSSSAGLLPGMNVTVPLRCACPTRSQMSNGVNYLLSYLVESGDIALSISKQFSVPLSSILDANGLSAAEPNIYPFTTLLIPLKTQPTMSQLTNPSPPPAETLPSAPANGKNLSDHTTIYVGAGVAVALCLLVLAAVLFYIRFKAKKKKKKETNMLTIVDESELSGKLTSSGLYTDPGLSERFLSSMSDIGKSLKVYKFEELQLATKNFSQECRIEGSVYRGLINRDHAAIKMMNKDVSREIEILKKINHFNLIKLSGLCSSHGHCYLVYEYADNGSLNNWIFDRSGSKVLSWMRRVQIALDVARGLNYLHSYTNPPYVHKDIKSSNILLDSKFRAKIANFGLARPAEGKGGQFELTRHIVGTKGYMASEYLEHGLISPKLDVYAFGVVMLELITGRDAASLQKGEDGFSIKCFTAMLTEEEQVLAKEKLETFIDPLLKGDYPLDSALFMARLIEGCVRKDDGSRMNMAEIVQSLSKLFPSSLSRTSSVSASARMSFRSETRHQTSVKGQNK